MKKSLLILCLLWGSAFGMISTASAQGTEKITDFHVEATLSKDRLLTITEEISYDFASLEQHGIYRVIPERYDRNGGKYRYHYQVGETLFDGQPVAKQVTTEGDNIRIRLGDPQKTVTGEHVYSITYTTDRAVNDFPKDGVRELYWNVTGNEWTIPIQHASLTLKGPGKANDIICFTGVYGSTEQQCDIETQGDSIQIMTRSDTDPTSPDLAPSQGLTVAIRYPEALIAPVSIQTKIMQFIGDNVWVFFPLAIFALMYALWFQKGRDPRGRGTVIAQFEEPRGLTTIEMDALLRQHISNRAVAATILDFGRRGYLKLAFEGDATDKPSWSKEVKFTLEKIAEADAKMKDFEATFFNELFPAGKKSLDVSETSRTVAVAVEKLKSNTFKSLVEQQLFTKNPMTVRALWIGFGFIGMFFSIYLSSMFGAVAALSLFLSAAIIVGFGWVMPRATREGAVVREEIQGFKLFLSVTEKDRIKFHNAPKTRPKQFERFLPAAVAFGVEKEWAQQFENLMIEPPSYFSGNTAGWSVMNSVYAANAFSTQASSAAFRAPSSSGAGGSGFSGGGSGGGGGGGGGGSW